MLLLMVGVLKTRSEEGGSTMSPHILLAKATRRPYNDEPEMPENATYNPGKGIWTIDDEPMVRSANYPERATKKCDQETGEDQKGE